MNLSSFEPAKHERRDTAAAVVDSLLIRDLEGAKFLSLSKAIESFGADTSFDHAVVTRQKALLFTLLRQGESWRVLEGEAKLTLNKRGLSGEASLVPGDLIEWKDGHAVFLGSQRVEPTARNPALEALARFSAVAHERGAVDHGLAILLRASLSITKAERSTLVAEDSEGAWRTLSEAHDENAAPRVRSADLISHTALREALRTRRPVVVSNLIDHPWSRLPSLMGSRIYSLACLPLVVDGRPFGALFLFTHSPGREIEATSLEDLALVTGQAALLVATQAELVRARQEARRLRSNEVVEKGPYWGESEPVRRLLRLVEKLAPSPLPLLVTGETGTGKEVVAREIHARSSRAKGPFVALNCAAIPESLIESMLFGHEKGAFTGALRSEPGRFRMASGGTLFLDEIGELPLELQAKLLRVLQEGEVEPVGARAPVKIDVRVLAATHRDLGDAVAKGSFRQDLYFRLRGAEIPVPSLRERRDDIEGLSRHLLRANGFETKLNGDAVVALKQYPWPGNVRELNQVLQRAVWLGETDAIGAKDLGLSIEGGRLEPDVGPTDLKLREAQKRFTDTYVRKALESSGGKRGGTAATLGISERTLYRMIAGTEGDDDDSAT